MSQVLVEKHDRLLVLTLNRAEKKNALTAEMYRTLTREISDADADPQIRCILLQGNGGTFTAGNDLEEFAALSADPTAAPAAVPFLNALCATRTPLVAAVNGRAVGVGTTLLLHCDLVYLAEDALLSAPFVNLALVPEAGSSLLLPLLLGHVRAFEMFVLGEPLTAADAVRLGLANRAVPPAELRPAARAAACAVAAQAPAAVLATKALMRNRVLLAERMQEEGEMFLQQLRSPELQEALRAFAQRRPPDFGKFT